MRGKVIVAAVVLLGCPIQVLAQDAEQDARVKVQLQRWLQEYPEADANDDGELTIEEARAYRRRMQRRADPATVPAYGFRTEFPFVTMSDGVQIALAVGFPSDFDPEADRRWPAMFEMMGYPDSAAPRPPRDFGDRYVTVRASVRGAGASGGQIRAISPRTGMDGHEIIEQWIAKQPWSNGKVALHGHSWGGLTGLMIAATNPPHLSAVAVSGLFDDVYRDIGRIGGIRNSGFPVNWMINLYLPGGPFRSGEAAVRARGMSPREYEQIVADRGPWDLEQGILWRSLHGSEYDPSYAQASPGDFAAGVRAPIHIMHAYQDEQTGPSGVWVWTYVPEDVPKRLVLSNGDHGDVRYFNRERMQWLDFWTIDGGQHDPADFLDPQRRVQVYFETPSESGRINQPLVARDFPLPETQWRRYFLAPDERLSATPPVADEGGDAVRTAVGRGNDVDGVHYLLEFDRATAICGPVSVSLWVRCSTIDTDLYVMLADVDAEGTVQMLQRGLLRASHRELDDERSRWITLNAQPVLIRPRHTHRDAQPLEPGKPCQLDIEIFPAGHVFREGHQLALWISQPPLGDPVTRHRDGEPAYMYESALPPATVTILRDQEHASSILLPVLPDLPPIAAEPPAPGSQAGIHIRE